MTQEVKEFFEKARSDIAKMKELTPNTINGFAALFSKVMQDGAISLLEKEFVAVGIAVAQLCTPCIRAHVKKCLDAGATKEQVLEAASVAVVMGGGPAYMHMSAVLDALEALESQ
ncbi:MAG: carboxymuconolactone decarboxylase family protein [Phycisphaerales bacterium]|nr:MAG: carboxymuconolactone decarboxylase family protein [Phycisphaerales bacterium]